MRRRIIDKGDNSDSSSTETDTTDSDYNYSDNENEEELQTLYATSSSYSEPVSNLTPVPDHGDEIDGKFVEISDNMRASYPDKEKPATKELQDLVSDRGRSSTMDHNMIDVKDIVANVMEESRLLGERDEANEPDIVRSTKTRTPPTTLQTQAEPQPEVKVTESEVKVTSSDVTVTVTEGTFAEPKAPPRRKKKLHLSTDKSIPETAQPAEVCFFSLLKILFSKLSIT